MRLYAYEGGADSDLMNHCDTIKIRDTKNTSLYNSEKTKITFYGDSRMDLVDGGGIWASSTMDQILNVPYSTIPLYVPQNDVPPYAEEDKFENEDIQNFGVSGATTGDILEHLNRCFVPDQVKYKVGRRFVYHAGGNNFLHAIAPSLALSESKKGHKLLPVALGWIFEEAKKSVRSELEQIVTILKNNSSETVDGKKDVLVVGGYPALFWYTPVPPDNKTYIINNLVNPFAQNPDKINGYLFFLNATLYISVGLSQMEGDYQGIAERHKVHYLKVWDEMYDVLYIAPDLIHPNGLGFNKWGSVVGKKLREIKFHTEKKSIEFTSTGNQWFDKEIRLRIARDDLEEKLSELKKKKAELELRERNLKEIQDKIREAEYKISLVKKRIEKVDSQITETKSKIAALDLQIEEARQQGKLEEEKILAEQKKQEEERLIQLEIEKQKAEAARLEEERQKQLLAIQQAEAARKAEVARQEAEAARLSILAAQERERQATEAARKAAEEAEAARIEQERINLIAACFFLGICHL
ncbi:MAG: hypothetical protein H7A25_23650 [Leptospiraceae bacterium]|nr:hypothetical protein [Leptospiraceae bacterium]